MAVHNARMWMLKGFYGNGNCARYQGCICQISLGGSKFWLLKSTTVLMHRYIESRPPLHFLIAAGGSEIYAGVQPPTNPIKYSPACYGTHKHFTKLLRSIATITMNVANWWAMCNHNMCIRRRLNTHPHSQAVKYALTSVSVTVLLTCIRLKHPEHMTT